MSRVADHDRAKMIPELRKFVPDAEVPVNMFEYAWTSDPIAKARALVSV